MATGEGPGGFRVLPTLALAKKKGANAVWAARDIRKVADPLQRAIVRRDMQFVIARNCGLTADENANDLVEALAVAVVIVFVLRALGLGWREALPFDVLASTVFALFVISVVYWLRHARKPGHGLPVVAEEDATA